MNWIVFSWAERERGKEHQTNEITYENCWSTVHNRNEIAFENDVIAQWNELNHEWKANIKAAYSFYSRIISFVLITAIFPYRFLLKYNNSMSNETWRWMRTAHRNKNWTKSFSSNFHLARLSASRFHLCATKMSFRTRQLVERTNRDSTLAVRCAQQTDESITLSSQINMKFTYSVIGTNW